jgi:hypothetical protein
VCRSKHVEPSVNFGMISSITKLHLVGISTELNLERSLDWFSFFFRSFNPYSANVENMVNS